MASQTDTKEKRKAPKKHHSAHAAKYQSMQCSQVTRGRPPTFITMDMMEENPPGNQGKVLSVFSDNFRRVCDDEIANATIRFFDLL